MKGYCSHFGEALPPWVRLASCLSRNRASLLFAVLTLTAVSVASMFRSHAPRNFGCDRNVPNPASTVFQQNEASLL